MGKDKNTVSVEPEKYCSLCKKAFSVVDIAYICKEMKKMYCYDCEHERGLPVPLCGFKFGPEHLHWSLQMVRA